MAPFFTSKEVLELLNLNEDSLVFYIQDKQLRRCFALRLAWDSAWGLVLPCSVP